MVSFHWHWHDLHEFGNLVTLMTLFTFLAFMTFVTFIISVDPLIMASGHTICLFMIIELLFYNARGLLFSILSKVHTEGMQFPKDIRFQWNQLNTNAPPLLCQKGNPLTACREWDSLRFLDTSSSRSIAFWWTIRTKQGYIVDLGKPSAFVNILNTLTGPLLKDCLQVRSQSLMET